MPPGTIGEQVACRGWIIISAMAHLENGDPEVPACPHLGLAADRRSHFMYPHPGHRCFVVDRPVPTDPSRQATYCLSGDYATCDRYGTPLGLPPMDARPLPRAKVQGPAAIAFRVHVVRAGDSLAGIAADHGLTADQVAIANGLALTDAIPEGVRLVIPLVPASSRYGSDP